MRIIKAIALVLPLALLMTPVHGVAQSEPGVLYSPEGDKALAAASQQARANLPIFWKLFDAAPSKQGYALKIRFATANGSSEHIWVNVLSHDARGITGTLANDPVSVPGLHYGSQVTARNADISDWGYLKNGRLYGHFTTRVLMTKATRQERDALLKTLSVTPLEPAY